MSTFSRRILGTDPPCILQMNEVLDKTLRKGDEYANMAQGQVHWLPPAEVLRELSLELPNESSLNFYGPDAGLPELREALRRKLAQENGLTEVEVMITAGANQGFANVVLALCDHADEAILFKPYYFNHLMALQMAGVTPVIADCAPDLTPAIDRIPFTAKTRLVALASPNNPTGVVIPPHTLQALADLCRERNVWFVCDETYEHFTFDGAVHKSPVGPNVIHLYSFSKAFGLAGWRIGYIGYPSITDGQNNHLGDQLLKVQDTVPICPSQIGQRLALKCLQQAGARWVRTQVEELDSSRRLVLQALTPLQAHIPANGALFIFVKLPERVTAAADDWQVAAWILRTHKLLVLPGSAFGMRGYLRISHANLAPAKCAAATHRLGAAARDLSDPLLDLSVLTASSLA